MKRSMCLSFFLFVSSLGFSATIYVPGDYAKIQEAIDAAVNGDTIIVAPGIYVEQINFLGKAITVESSDGPEVTTIDASNETSVVWFTNNEGTDSILDGFTITNGSGGGTVPNLTGGGITCRDSSPTIRNNIITVNDSIHYGGGIYCIGSNPIITNNVINGNIADFGGGILCDESSPVITNNTFQQNEAIVSGGGIYIKSGSSEDADVEITENLICDNIADFEGGGIYCANVANAPVIIAKNTIIKNKIDRYGAGIFCRWIHELEISYNLIAENRAVHHGSGIYCLNCDIADITYNTITLNECSGLESRGAGIFCKCDCYSYQPSYPRIAFNTIVGNSSTWIGGGGGAQNWGGGIYCEAKKNANYWLYPTIDSNIIIGNDSWNGGGICCEERMVDAVIVNNILTGNWSPKGAAIFCSHSIALICNNTIFENQVKKKAAIYCEEKANLTVVNTILWNNGSPSGGYEIWIQSTSKPSTLSISYSDVDGGQSSVHTEPGCTLNWGAGMIDADPLFVDPLVDDLHIQYTSPCRNSGDNSAAGLPSADFEGDPRPDDYIGSGVVDMGADEFYTHLYYTGIPSPGGTVTVKLIGLPGSSPVILYIGSGVLEEPILTDHGYWYLKLPLVGEITLPLIPGNGVESFPYDLPMTPGPYSLPMQALIGDQLTNLCVIYVE